MLCNGNKDNLWSASPRIQVLNTLSLINTFISNSDWCSNKHIKHMSYVKAKPCTFCIRPQSVATKFLRSSLWLLFCKVALQRFQPQTAEEKREGKDRGRFERGFKHRHQREIVKYHKWNFFGWFLPPSAKTKNCFDTSHGFTATGHDSTIKGNGESNLIV